MRHVCRPFLKLRFSANRRGGGNGSSPEAKFFEVKMRESTSDAHHNSNGSAGRPVGSQVNTLVVAELEEWRGQMVRVFAHTIIDETRVTRRRVAILHWRVASALINAYGTVRSMTSPEEGCRNR